MEHCERRSRRRWRGVTYRLGHVSGGRITAAARDLRSRTGRLAGLMRGGRRGLTNCAEPVSADQCVMTGVLTTSCTWVSSCGTSPAGEDLHPVLCISNRRERVVTGRLTGYTWRVSEYTESDRQRDRTYRLHDDASVWLTQQDRAALTHCDSQLHSPH